MPKFYDKVNVLKKPEWLKIRLQSDEASAEVERIVKEHSLHTICSSGLCPNKAECWRRRTATFMILGDICTRGCRFCATKTGIPLAPDASEPQKVAESVRLMGLRHVVVTSVTRDDLSDGGARHWAAVVEAIRKENPDATIELLIPDLDARADLIEIVAASQPDIVGHNIETVERLTPVVRSRAKYRTSLRTLEIISSARKLVRYLARERTSGVSRSTVSMLCPIISGLDAATISIKSALASRSGIRSSIVASGFIRRIASTVAAQCWAPPSGRSSRVTEVTTTCRSPIRFTL